MWPGCISLDAAGKKWHEEKQFPLFPWSSQARGFFTGKYSRGDGDTSDTGKTFYSNINWERLERARELGARGMANGRAGGYQGAT